MQEGDSRAYPSDGVSRDDHCIYDLIHDLDAIVWEVDDVAQVFTFVSHRAEAMLGHPVERWLAEPNFWSRWIVHPADRARVLESCLRAARKESEHSIEYRAVTAAGNVLWLRHASRPFRDASGQRRRRGIIFDITEQKRTEAALRESEARFRMLVENISDITAVIGSDHRFRYVSPAMEGILGYRVAEVEGRSPLELVHPDDAGYLEQRMVSRLRGEGDPKRLTELRFRHRDGSWRTLQIRGRMHEPEPGDPVIVLTARDVTERRRSEEELRRQRAYFARLFEGAPEAIVLLDEGDRVQRVNREFCNLFGYTSAEALGRVVTELVVPAELVRESRSLTERAVRGERVRIETVRRRKDGTLVPVTILAVPVEFEDGTTHIYGIYRDATARKKAEQALAESEAQLRHAQKMEAVGRLAGAVAHDFNNVLTAIQGYAQLLLDGLGETDPLREDAEEVWNSAARATGLTRQLLAFSRKQILKPEAIDLNAIVAGLDKLLRQLISEEIDFEVVLPKGLDRVIADPGQIEQVLMNLVSNARDAMPKGGTLTIETRNVALCEERAAHLSGTLAPGGYVLLEVRDTGTGIAPEIRDRIFEPFFTTKEPGRGTGLGLSTVFGIVKQSGGAIRVESVPGEGTTVQVFLPRTEEAGSPRSSPPGASLAGAADAVVSEGAGTRPGARTAAGGEVILVVEDEEAVRSLVCKVLRKYGYLVRDAVDGVMALQMLERERSRIDLVITDVAMPGMSGPELAERVHREWPELPFLFMSGYAEDELVRRGTADGRMLLLEKPFSPGTLIRRVREALEGVPVGSVR